MGSKFYSIDIFDTALTRVVIAPADILLLTGEALLRQGVFRISPMDFAQARGEAYARAQAETPRTEPKLALIYEKLRELLHVTSQQATAAQQAELECERQNIVAMPGCWEMLDRIRRSGATLAYLSDMYLPSAFLREQLSRFGLVQPEEGVVVSCEFGASKSSGELYRRLRETLDPEQQRDWTHIGDNPHSDVKMAREAGVRAVCAGSGPNRYERMCRGEGLGEPLWRSRLAATMRLARLHGVELSGHDGELWMDGCNIVGPVLVGFVSWCLSEAQRLGIERLYFLSRDGQVLCRVAEALQKRWHLPVSCHYLYGSRQAWNAAGWLGDLDEALGWALIPTDGLSLAEVFERLHLDAGDFRAQLESNEFASSTWTLPLGDKERDRLASLFKRGLFTDAMRTVSRLARDLTLHYLKQEGLAQCDKVGLVDIGWRGSLQLNLQRLLREETGKTRTLVHGLYLGLVSKPKEVEPGLMHSYWDCCELSGKPISTLNLALFEAFTSADHGGVLGYRQSDDGTVVPVLSAAVNSAGEQWGVPLLQAAVVRYATEFALRFKPDEVPGREFLGTWLEMFTVFYDDPTVAEARCWARMSLSAGQVERSFIRPVPAWGWPRLLLSVVPWVTRPACWWQAATFAQAGEGARSFYKLLRRLRSALRRQRVVVKAANP